MICNRSWGLSQFSRLAGYRLKKPLMTAKMGLSPSAWNLAELARAEILSL
jgi:hypothetical protein